MSTTVILTSAMCAETDSNNKTQVTNDSFDVGAYPVIVNESFAYFDVSSINPRAVIESCVFKLRQCDGGYIKTVTIRVTPCTSYIANTSVCWNNSPSVSETPYADISISGNDAADRLWTLTGNLNAFRNNNFIIIKAFAPSTSAGDNDAKKFCPSTHSNISYRPQLTVVYHLPLLFAATKGPIDKEVVNIMIAPTKGAINKAVQSIMIAPVKGPIDKTVF